MNQDEYSNNYLDSNYELPQFEFNFQIPQLERPEIINPTQLRTDTIQIEERDMKYKNVPKQIGNNYCQYLNKTKKEGEPLPQGAQMLFNKRSKTKQSNIKIIDLQESCRDDQSKELFQNYIEKQYFIDLLFSNKVANCISYIPVISNYYAAAGDPEKMKSNYIMRDEFVQKKVKTNT